MSSMNTNVDANESSIGDGVVVATPAASAVVTNLEMDDDVTMNVQVEQEVDQQQQQQQHTIPSIPMKTIQEGSCQMVYPSNQDSAVFYNPVQVQNRDLSILMITLYMERRAQRILDTLQRKEMKQKNKKMVPTDDDVTTTTNDTTTTTTNIDEQLTNDETTKTMTGPEAVQLLATKYNPNYGISILDALAASGLRSLRYWKELPQNGGVHHITINDLEEAAIERAHMNVTMNQLKDTIVSHRQLHGIRINHNDATCEMYNSRPLHPILLKAQKLKEQQQRQQQQVQNGNTSTASDMNSSTNSNCNTTPFAPYHVIDLDPYGSAAPFLDAAVQAVIDGDTMTHGRRNGSNGDTIGFLCVTCTDMAALGGSHPETAFGRYYGSMPIPRAGYLQEMAIRILLHSIAVTAAKYGKTIRPVLSVGMDFYIRVFVEIGTDKAGINQLSIDKIGYVYQSTQCPSYHIVPSGKLGGTKGTAYQPGRMPTIPPIPSTSSAVDDVEVAVDTKDDDEGTSNTRETATTTITDNINNNNINRKKKHQQKQQQQPPPQHIGSCQETGSTFKIGGPIWLGPMHDPDVVKEAIIRVKSKNHSQYPNMKYIATADRIHGLLLSCQEELQDAPLFYRLPELAQTVNVSTPPILKFKAALSNAGYNVSGYHKDPQAIKTNAPNYVVWDILREWVRLNPPKKPIVPNSIASKVLGITSTLPSHQIDFTISRSSSSDKSAAVSRFPMNPQPNWGPKSAAKGHTTTSSSNTSTGSTQKRKQPTEDEVVTDTNKRLQKENDEHPEEK